LQRAQFAHETRITSVADRPEVLGIELREKRIAVVQVWIMRAEACFEKLTTITDRFESLARGLAVTVVSSQITQRLFAFEHRC
jgi:hypothetical protein